MHEPTVIQKKAEYFEKAIQDRHLHEGLLLPTIVLPPEGKDDFTTGNYENSALFTGIYIAAQAFKYAVTKDPTVKQQAKESVKALHKLQDITGVEGLIARGYKKTGLSWDEKFFWEKAGREGDEWHQNKDGERWLGDPSKSQVLGVLFGYFAYTQFCEPEEQEEQEISEYVSNIVVRIVEGQGKLKDKNKKTSYGNYNPKFLGQSIGPFLMLGQLKLADSLSDDFEFLKQYTGLLIAENYFRFLEKGRINIPIYNRFNTFSGYGSEDNLAMLNTYMLLTLEEDEILQRVCKKGLEKRWKTINDPNKVLFNFIYHALTEQNDTPELEQGINALERFPINKTVDGLALRRELTRSGFFRSLFGGKQDIEDWPIDEYAWRTPHRRDQWVSKKQGKMEFTGLDFLIAANLGKFHGFISE